MLTYVQLPVASSNAIISDIHIAANELHEINWEPVLEADSESELDPEPEVESGRSSSRKQIREQLERSRQQSLSDNDDADLWSTQREEVKGTFITAWNDYKEVCFGQDELFPNGPRCRNWIGLGLTIIDAIDTMHLMELQSEFESARTFIAETLDFNKDVSVSFFETVIRCVGTMITMYDITEDELYLDHLRVLMDNLLPAFNTKPLGFPASDVNLRNGDIHISGCKGKCVVFADIASVQLEFNAACDRLKEYKYCNRSDGVINKLDPMHSDYALQGELALNGHYPIQIGLDGHLESGIYRWGAMGDSFYEYLLKLWIYESASRKNHVKDLGYFYDDDRVSQYKRMYITAVDAMLEHLYHFNEESGLWFISEIDGDKMTSKMDELACFVGGNLALASYWNITGESEKSEKYLNAAMELTETCYRMWHQTKSGLAPEFVVFNKKGMHSGGGADYYLLRPETVESLFYLYRITKDEKYRAQGYEIYKAIERNCRVDNEHGRGYAPVDRVSSNARAFRSGMDHVMVMHSFFLSETLKYLYLLFSNDDLVSLDQVVFNTEAHLIFL